MRVCKYSFVFLTTYIATINLQILTFPQVFTRNVKIVGKKSLKTLACGLMWVYNGRSGKQINTTEQNNLTTNIREGAMSKIDYFERKLDDKRRLTVPSELHAEFDGGVVITRGFGQYLHLYPKTVWEEDMETALVGDILDERIADLNVKFRSGKSEAELDAKQGRFMIEQHLMDYARIDREIVAVRAGKYWRLSAK